jgi:hypothetical protein
MRCYHFPLHCQANAAHGRLMRGALTQREHWLLEKSFHTPIHRINTNLMC